MRVAVITPVSAEPREWIEEATESVRRQILGNTISEIRHYLIFDGPRSEMPEWRVGSETVLAVGHRAMDSGQTPRSVGARRAIDEWDADLLAFLDADDALQPDHLLLLTEAMILSDADMAMAPMFRCDAGLRFVGANGPVYTIGPAVPVPGTGDHHIYISQSSSAIVRKAFALVDRLTLPGKRMVTHHDWFLSWLAASQGYRLAWSVKPTYRYRVLRPGFYRDYNLPVPDEVNRPKTTLEKESIAEWESLTPAEKAAYARSIGIRDGRGTVREPAVYRNLTGRNPCDVVSYDRAAGVKTWHRS